MLSPDNTPSTVRMAAPSASGISSSASPVPPTAPLPAVPAAVTATVSAPGSRRSSIASRGSGNALSPSVSPRTLLRPHLGRASTTTLAAAAGAFMSADAPVPPRSTDPFHQGATISINQPVGSLSISPSSRDVCLASRKGLYILDLANLESAPRFVPQGGTWQIADVQWSPHAVTDNLILSTSCQKLLVWDLAANVALNRSIEAHERAITDINWHALNPNMMATVGMDAAVRAWDLRHDCKRPAVRLSAWGAAGTQVKWNRQNEYVLATAHHRDVLIWDTRKGSVPLDTVKAHESKIYGIDWDRVDAHKLVTCSLDKTIKFWSIPSLSGGRDGALYTHPLETISTNYPVWRARHLPFGKGVLALPQRGETALEMFGIGGDTPLERFEGSTGVVKEFVWRIRGGTDQAIEDREFQLVTWSKDRKLRIWNVPREVTEKAGCVPGARIPYRSSRIGAKNRTFTLIPGGDARANGIRPPQVQGQAQSSSPVFNFGPVAAGPSGIARQRLMAHTQREAGMTRGGGQARKIDQLEWLTKVVKTDDHAGGRTDSTPGSRTPSVSGRESSSGSRSRSATVRDVRDGIRPLSASTRTPSRVRDRNEEPAGEQLMPLKDEVLLVHKRFPKSKVNFERFDLTQRKLTMAMNGPWANGNRVAFVRIHWSFPQNYPYGNEIPTFELERNATVSQITRQRMVSTIKEIRLANRQCLVSVTEFLLGYHERPGRRTLEEESGSDNDEVDVNVPMLIRTTGAVFGPNGQLVCFFPKQTVLPRARQSLSRSPSGMSDPLKSPLARAISALSRMENPNKPAVSLRYRRHVRRMKAMLAPVQQRSMVSLRNVSHLLNEPDITLAAVYTTTSPETNFRAAVEGKRLDHAEVWQAVHGVLTDPPPPYSDLPAVRGRRDGAMERILWERGMERKRRVLDDLFERRMEAADIQLLALVACMLAEHDKAAPPPPPAIEEIVQKSPERGYFVLPDAGSHPHAIGPLGQRRASSLTPTTPPVSASVAPSSFRTSGWSQILMNPSSISLRGMTLTPRDRSSFDIPNRTSVGSVDEVPTSGSSPGRGVAIRPRRQNSTTSTGATGSFGMILSSPRRGLDRRDSASREQLRRPLSATTTWSPPTTAVPPTPSRLIHATTVSTGPSSDGSGHSAGGVRHKVSFGSGSPLRRAFSRAPNLTMIKRRTLTCSVRIDLNAENEPPAAINSLLRAELAPLAEIWKLAYADFLLRAGLVGRRAAILQYEFADVEGTARDAASGDLPGQDLVLANMCRFCNERLLLPGEVRCPVCARDQEKPLCGVCRLPIKGLATTCTTCSHTSHTRCLRSVMVSPTDHCPSCLCRCLAERGLSGGFATAPKPAPTVAGWPTMALYRNATSPTRLDFDGSYPPDMDFAGAIDRERSHVDGLDFARAIDRERSHTDSVDFARAIDREPEPEPEPEPSAWWNPLAEPKVVSYLKHLRPVDTGVASHSGPASAAGDDRERWGAGGGGHNFDIAETPVDELRMGLSGLGPTHHARRATFTGTGVSGGYGALELEPGQPDSEEDQNRSRLRTLGREGILGW